MKVLELFSGIGGMHLALAESGLPYEVLASVDINTVANAVYKHNFPETPLLNRNIESLTAEFVNDLGVDTILMSPPCQPFTRNGLKGDVADNRTNAFKCLLDLLLQLENIQRILMENVKGFEGSVMREMFVEKLGEAGYGYKEFILSPSEFGVPNSRCRYYCLAAKDVQLGTLQFGDPETFSIAKILEKGTNFEEFKISEKVLQKRAAILDICYSNSKRSCCFTKAYGRYLEGTGSVYSENSQEHDSVVFRKLSEVESSSQQYLDFIRMLKLRFFTPKEICRLMCFPEYFSFPGNISIKQRYMLLGNSVNVKVVSELIKLLNI